MRRHGVPVLRHGVQVRWRGVQVRCHGCASLAVPLLSDVEQPTVVSTLPEYHPTPACSACLPRSCRQTDLQHLKECDDIRFDNDSKRVHLATADH